MTSNLLYALATLFTWIGWAAVIGGLFAALSLLMGSVGPDRPRQLRGLATCGLTAAVAFALGAAIPRGKMPEAEAVLRLPLVWFVMPFQAWLAVASIAMLAFRGVQAWMAISAAERTERLKAVGLWLGAAILFILWYGLDPANKVNIMRGVLPLTGKGVAVVALLIVAALAAMVASQNSTRARGVSKAVASQLALLAGSVVFGLPFAFLVITSFKEDRDMSSPNGIVWIPKVTETVPYYDKTNPIYEGTYQGKTVQGTILESRPDGTARVDIQKPLAIRGATFEARLSDLKQVPKPVPIVTAKLNGTEIKGMVIEETEDGRKRVEVMEPASLKGKTEVFNAGDVEPVRHVGLRTANYGEALDFLPPETNNGLVYLKNTLLLVLLSVVGTILSSSIVAYGFSRLKFPGRDALFMVLLSTMMLPGAVTLMPQFLIFRNFGWIDTLYPLWVPAFFASAFNVFLLRQFFMQIPMELEDASKIDGCGYLKTFWSIMLPQIKPALAVIAIWTFMGAWNNFMGPLIYVNSPENMPLSYALQLFQGDRSGEPGLLMAFATLTLLPVLALFFFAQRYFIEGVTLSGLGGR